MLNKIVRGIKFLEITAPRTATLLSKPLSKGINKNLIINSYFIMQMTEPEVSRSLKQSHLIAKDTIHIINTMLLID